MIISGIHVEILEGGVKRVVVQADFQRSEEIEDGDIPALMNHLRELGGEETEKAPAKAETKPRRSRSTKAEVEDVEAGGEAEEVTKPKRSRGRPKKDEAEDVEDETEEEQEEAPRKRKPRATKKADDGVSDQDLIKACAGAKEELAEAFDEDVTTEILDEVLGEFGVKNVGKIEDERREEFLERLKTVVAFQLED